MEYEEFRKDYLKFLEDHARSLALDYSMRDELRQVGDLALWELWSEHPDQELSYCRSKVSWAMRDARRKAIRTYGREVPDVPTSLYSHGLLLLCAPG
jgi:hypothetical protein